MRRVRPTILPLLSVVVLLAAGSAVDAQQEPLDLTGTWDLESTILLDGEEEPCVFGGTVPVTQDAEGTTWEGMAELSLVSGPSPCPAEMLGDLVGEVTQDGGQTFINGFIDGGQLGLVDFSGTISPNPGGTGTLSATEGPFAGHDGTWLAELQQSVLEIPVLTPIGFTIATLLLMASGAWLLSRPGVV